MSELLPVPDPSKLTTEQLYREITALEKLLDTKIQSLVEAHTEFKHTFKALHGDLNREMETKLQFMKELHTVSLNSLKELHNAAIHDTQKNAELLTGVLQATVAESRDSYTKQFDAVNLNTATQNKANSERMEEMKGRIDRSEGAVFGHSDTEKGFRDRIAIWIALVAAMAGVALFIASYHKV